MTGPPWWPTFRRTVVFLLGCAVIIDALTQTTSSVGKLIIGLLMVGVLPVDDLLRLVRSERVRERDDTDRR